MKIRSGFVSNSSSSSFVVVFSKRPKNVSDVIVELFGADGTSRPIQLTHCDYAIPAMDAASIVFGDIKAQRKATLKKVAEEFSSRYYWVESHNCHSWDGSGFVNSHGWGPSINEECFGVDKKLLKKLENASKEQEKNSKDACEFRRELERKAGIVHSDFRSPTYAEDSKKCQKQLDELYKTAEYEEWNKRQLSEMFATFDKIAEIKREVAESDAKAFMEKYSDKWIGVFEYSDGDGEFYCVLEHGGTFNLLPHVRISHH